MSPIAHTILLLSLSNVFMTFAWHAHLKTRNDRAWWIAALASWDIVLFEYLLPVPANRIGDTVRIVPQLKFLQELITLAVFVPVALLCLRQGLKLDDLWASLCMLGAVYFMFRSHG
jgi:uncharacterized protein (DUF486 family)